MLLTITLTWTIHIRLNGKFHVLHSFYVKDLTKYTSLSSMCLFGFLAGAILGVVGANLFLKPWSQPCVRPPRLCGLTFAVQMNFTVTDRTQMTAVYSNSHNWNLMQTLWCFKYVVSFSCQRWVSNAVFFHLYCTVYSEGLLSLAGLLVLHLWRCCFTQAENLHANPVIWPQFRLSGPQLSAYLPFMDICFTSCATGQILPSSAALPANILCIWTASCGPPPL